MENLTRFRLPTFDQAPPQEAPTPQYQAAPVYDKPVSDFRQRLSAGLMGAGQGMLNGGGFAGGAAGAAQGVMKLVNEDRLLRQQALFRQAQAEGAAGLLNHAQSNQPFSAGDLLYGTPDGNVNYINSQHPASARQANGAAFNNMTGNDFGPMGDAMATNAQNQFGLNSVNTATDARMPVAVGAGFSLADSLNNAPPTAQPTPMGGQMVYTAGGGGVTQPANNQSDAARALTNAFGTGKEVKTAMVEGRAPNPYRPGETSPNPVQLTEGLKIGGEVSNKNDDQQIALLKQRIEAIKIQNTNEYNQGMLANARAQTANTAAKNAKDREKLNSAELASQIINNPKLDPQTRQAYEQSFLRMNPYGPGGLAYDGNGNGIPDAQETGTLPVQSLLPPVAKPAAKAKSDLFGDLLRSLQSSFGLGGPPIPTGRMKNGPR